MVRKISFYAGTTLKIPVKITNADQRPAPLHTIPCDFSHSPGVAKITGTATTIAKDTRIRRRTNPQRQKAQLNSQK